jgi:hypothetical protein
MFHPVTEHVGRSRSNIASIGFGIVDPIDVYGLALVLYKALDASDYFSIPVRV